MNHTQESAGDGPQPMDPGMVAPSTGDKMDSRMIPVIGIGASAGGLDALENLLRHIPPDSGLAIVILQHLDPNHQDLTPELLQKVTEMKVSQVVEPTPVKINQVFILPPNNYISIKQGVLHLEEPTEPRGLRLPIDFFFSSLAADLRERSIGVILSGMGTDGTLGLKAIKEKGGICLVQEPATARFKGMPLSAIESGVADIIAPLEILAKHIVSYVRKAPLGMDRSTDDVESLNQSVEKIVEQIRELTGHDFAHYKRSTLCRRIERRMGLRQIETMEEYAHSLPGSPQEVELLFKELLIGVTRFFRDPEAWNDLSKHVFPALLKGRTATQPIRVWCVGCSTGEEAFSVAILFKEMSEQLAPGIHLTVQIFATDLDRDAIAQARTGCFPASIAADVNPERLKRFFTEEEKGFRIKKTIRDMIIFAPHNVVADPPFTKLDLITCRNLLIYLTLDLQEKIFPIFHYCLNDPGFLFLGSAENIGSMTSRFSPVNGRTRLYQGLKPDGPAARRTGFSSLDAPPRIQSEASLLPHPGTSLQSAAEELLLQNHTPTAVMTNTQGDIVYISGRTGAYLEPVAGKANWNLLAMAKEGLAPQLQSAFREALTSSQPITRKNLPLDIQQGEFQGLDIHVSLLKHPKILQGLVLVVFKENTLIETAPQKEGDPAPPGQTEYLQNQLQQARLDMQSMQQEMQTSQEESRSINEELQSMNEELTTSQEEMQSMNEELQTLNSELQHKLNDLSRLNNDLKNLLDCAEIATLFLDPELKVRLFTEGSNQVFRLIPGDVGRLITDITSNIIYPNLVADAKEVLRTLVVHEQRAQSTDDRWFVVRIMPYRTVDNQIDGVVITFMDITASRLLETELNRLQDPSTSDHTRKIKKKGTSS